MTIGIPTHNPKRRPPAFQMVVSNQRDTLRDTYVTRDIVWVKRWGGIVISMDDCTSMKFTNSKTFE